jgi:hypothetical protein
MRLARSRKTFPPHLPDRQTKRKARREDRDALSLGFEG